MNKNAYRGHRFPPAIIQVALSRCWRLTATHSDKAETTPKTFSTMRGPSLSRMKTPPPESAWQVFCAEASDFTSASKFQHIAGAVAYLPVQAAVLTLPSRLMP
jgi:hypothetical protein